MEAQRNIDNNAPGLWVIDPQHTSIEFSIKISFFFTVRGRLTDFAGTLVLDEADIRRSSVLATIKAASINTGIKQRDTHLRSKDYLETARYPEIHFQSTKVERGRDRDTLRVSGILTIKGTSREVVLEVTEVDRSRSPKGQEVAYYAAQVELDRFAFGVKHLPGLIGRKLQVNLNVQAMRQALVSAA
jgi:polyisoprenoid-binding protein YceI